MAGRRGRREELKKLLGWSQRIQVKEVNKRMGVADVLDSLLHVACLMPLLKPLVFLLPYLKKKKTKIVFFF